MKRRTFQDVGINMFWEAWAVLTGQKWWKTTHFDGFLKKPEKWRFSTTFRGFFKKPSKWVENNQFWPFFENPAENAIFS